MSRFSVEKSRSLKKEAVQLAQTNPTLSLSQIARHIGVTPPTVARYLKDLKVCGAKLTVERYGGGVRYACPNCDVSSGTIRWNNGTTLRTTCNRLVIDR